MTENDKFVQKPSTRENYGSLMETTQELQYMSSPKKDGDESNKLIKTSDDAIDDLDGF